MYVYKPSQWILFFFLYSFVGWIWESCYVSAIKKEWVNRGFMHGPILPLYGSGAVVILVSTIGVRDNLLLTFVCGMVMATALEYVTGAVMERMFHVRYWDYSDKKGNVNGYIYPAASVCWGCFSILLVRLVHVPVEDLIMKIPPLAADVTAFIFVTAAAVDFTQSFNEAMDMKRVLVQLEESKRQIRHMQEKLKTVSEETIEEYRNYMEQHEIRRKLRREEYLKRVHERREARREQLRELSARVEQLMAEGPGEEFRELKQNIAKELQKLDERTDVTYLRVARVLKRNPRAVSGKFKEALEEIKKTIDIR